ncbi:MAG: phosphoglycerate kinase [Erysipelotrichaceae bacterium]|nr:phosphoglycerate kinase [Erysipelotrichaceae bacterium]
MKKTIKDFDLNNKKVIIRVDFNVPIKDGIIKDDNRIVESLETINYALSHNAKVILLSHLGRIKEESDKSKNNLEVVAKRLSELLHKDVIFAPTTRNLESYVDSLKSGEVLLVQNTRYEDLDGKKESGNAQSLGAYWASLGDIFINDAFGTSHRAHASNVGIASHLPSGIGFLVEKELKAFWPVLNDPARPFTVILGGAKVSDKIGVIKELVEKADYLLIGGGMAYTFLKALGKDIGSSLLDSESLAFASEMLNKYSNKIILPVDHVCASSISDDVQYSVLDEIKGIGLDIGPKTIELFKSYLLKSKTIVWNGPVGYSELEHFSKGTKALCEIIASTSAYTVVGGGDTAAAVIKMGYKNKFSHISTGGGASLELLEGKKLPGIEIIDDK